MGGAPGCEPLSDSGGVRSMGRCFMCGIQWVYIYIHIHIHIHIRACMHTYIYIYICMYTYIHTYM